VTNLEVKMKVNSIAMLTRGMEMRDRALDLARNGHRSPNSEGKVLPITVQRIRHASGIQVSKPRSRWSHASSSLTGPELAAKLSIPVNWLYVQIREKRLLLDRQPSGAYLLQDAPVVLDSIRNLRNHTINVSVWPATCSDEQLGPR
jgi:hypothetical protein